MRPATSPVLRTAALIIALLGILMMALPLPSSRPRAQSQRPNILIIMTDDQSHDTLTDQFMPNTKAMIADQGITFTRAYMSTAICCPSRASFLTGKYARHHGVHGNRDKLDETTLANRLQSAGYYTGMVGKYLNSWPGDARPEFNYWACWRKGYLDPQMNISGAEQEVPGYLTYILRDYALEFLNKAPDAEPFFLLFAPHAPHAPAVPAPGDENLYADLPPWRPPSFNPASQSDKPQWLQDIPLLTPEEISYSVDRLRLKQLRSLHAVDTAVRDLLDKLREQGKLDNTLVVFYSDNGLFWGEHRLLHKDQPYEEASRVPFAVRYPPLVQSPRIEDRLIQGIDIAPTIYDLAGIATPGDVDGRSLVPLLNGTTDWRDAILLEGWPGKQDDEDTTTLRYHKSDLAVHYRAIRTEQYVYIETDKDTPELYDTSADPYQMNNLVNSRKYKRTVKVLRSRLKKGEF